jgi:hypothetical protein
MTHSTLTHLFFDQLLQLLDTCLQLILILLILLALSARGLGPVDALGPAAALCACSNDTVL